MVADRQVLGVLADWQSRFLWSYEQGSTRGIQAFAITPGTGDLTPSQFFTGLDSLYVVDWAEDHSAKYVFTSYRVGNPTDGRSPGIASWLISADGDLKTETEFTTTNQIGSIAVARQSPN